MRIFTTARRHTAASLCRGTRQLRFDGLSVHSLFDGVAIGSGFVVSSWLGWLIFLAIFLHKAPEGFTMASVMLAAGGAAGRRSGRLWTGCGDAGGSAGD